jgi:hypothetical protein
VSPSTRGHRPGQLTAIESWSTVETEETGSP